MIFYSKLKNIVENNNSTDIIEMNLNYEITLVESDLESAIDVALYTLFIIGVLIVSVITLLKLSKK